MTRFATDATPRVLYYALGGGLGHGMRELALARQLARRVGGRHVLLVNTPLIDTLRAAAASDPTVEIQALAPAASPSEAGRWVLAQRDELAPSLIVVDTFPRGLGGELAEWLPGWSSGYKAIVSRTLPPEYVRTYRLAQFAADAFDLAFAPGEPSPLEGASGDKRLALTRTAPWLVRSPREVAAPDAAAARLGCSGGRRCVLVVGSGSVAECDEWRRWFVELACDWPRDAPPLRLALPCACSASSDVPGEALVRHAPLMELFRGAALVVGNAGYHLVHETRALGVPALFLARTRRYDDQQVRLAEHERTSDWSDLRRRLSGVISAGEQAERSGANRLTSVSSPHVPNGAGVPNGAEQAAEILARCWSEFTDS